MTVSMYNNQLCYYILFLLIQGLEMEEVEDQEEEGLVRKPSKGSKRRAGSKVQRRETIIHPSRSGRMSVQLESGATGRRRSNIVPRRKSTPAVVTLSSPLVEEAPSSESLEMAIVHSSKTSDV